MADRTVSVLLRAEVGKFQADMNAAGKAASSTATAVENAASKVETATRRQADSASSLRAAEMRLVEVQNRKTSTAAQVAAAEERVNRARRSNETATKKLAQAEASHKQAMDGAAAAATRNQTALGKLTAAGTKYRSEMTTAGTAMTVFGGAVVGGLGLATKAAMSWQSSWAGVTKTVNGSSGQLSKLEGDLRNMARTLPASHEEIAAVAEAAGQLGIKTDNVASFTKTMIDMGESTNLSADEAATSLARFMNVMGTSQDNVGKLGASIVGLGNNFATTESEIMEMASRISGAGKQANMSEGDVLGFATALSSVGIDAEAGGTAISMSMKKMGNAVQDGGDKLDEMAKVSGMSSAEFKQAWEKDSAGAMNAFVEGLGKAQDEGQNTNKILSDLGISGIRESDAMLRLSSAHGVLADALKTGNSEYEKGIALQNEANKRYETAESKIKMAGNALKDNAIDIGGAVLPALAQASDAVLGLTKVFSGLPGPLKNLVGLAGGAAGGLTLLAGGAMLLVPRIAETITAFKSLSDWVKTSDSRMATMTGRLGKMKGALAGVAAAQTAFALAGDPLSDWGNSATKATGETADALQRFAGEAASGSIKADTLNKSMSDLISGTGGMSEFGSAVKAALNPDIWGKSDQFMAGFVRTVTLGSVDMKSNVDEVKDRFSQMGQQIASLPTAEASQAFQQMVSSTDQSAESVYNLLELMPAYKNALTEQAKSMGLGTDQATLAKLALGEFGNGAQTAADKAKGVGDAASGAAKGLKEMLDGLLATGMATLSERDAMRNYEDAIDGVGKAIKENGTSLDITTEKGRANQSAFDAIAKSGMDAARAMAENGKSQKDVQGQLKGTYDNLINAAHQFGITGSKADDLARRVMGIPKGANIKSWMSDAARKEAEKTSGAAKDANGKKVSIPTKAPGAEQARQNINKAGNAADQVNGKKVNIFVRIWRTITGQDDDPSPTVRPKGGDGKRPNPTGQTGVAYAKGGPVWGAGTETSDSIPARLSRGEHVWTAREVRGAGGHAAVEGLRARAAQGDVSAFAQGGAVGAAEKRVNSAQKRVTAAQRAKSDASKSNKRAAELRLRAAKDDLAAARRALSSARKSDSAAKKAAEEAKRRAQEARERRERVGELRRDARSDLRRGNFREEITGGLSGAYSAVDRFGELSRNKDLSSSQRRSAGRSAQRYEGALRGLYKSQDGLEKSLERANKQLDRANTKLEKAKSHLEDMKQIQSGVASDLLGERKLDLGTYSTFQGGKWQTTGGVKGAAKTMRADVGKMRAFAAKMNKLQKAGLPGDILQEIASAGLEDGSALADQFLNASKADQKSYVGAWKDYSKYANQAGKYVSNAFSPGGVDAAQAKVNAEQAGVNTAKGLIRGIESQQKAVEKALQRMAKSMERALRKALGIHSPSTVMADIARWVPEGAAAGILGNLDAVVDAASAMSAAMLPTPDIGSIPQATAMPALAPAAAQTATAGTAMPPADPNAQWSPMTDATTKAMTDAQAAITTAYKVMDDTTTASLTARTTATKTNMTTMQTDTTAGMEGMKATISGANNAMLTGVKNTHASLLSETRSHNKNMLEDTRTQYEAIRSSATGKVSSMRSSVNTTMGGLHDDYTGRMKRLRELNTAGFSNIEAHGKDAFSGIRSGMNAQMGRARPELGGKLNALISLFGKFVNNVNGAFGDVGVKLNAPARLKYATGGTMPGYTPGRDVHTFYSPTAGILELSGGEPVLRPEAGRVLGTQWVDGVNHAAMSGGVAGVQRFLDLPHEKFATGGTIPRNTQGLIQLGKMLQGMGVRVSEGPGPFGPVHRVHAPNSWHYRQGAIDLNTAAGQSAKEMADFDRIMPLLYKLGWGVIWRYTGHYNHAHVDLGNRSLGSFNRNPNVSGDLWAKLQAMRVGSPTGGAGSFIPPFLEKAGIKTFAGDMKTLYTRAANVHLNKAMSAVSGDLAALNPSMRDLANGVLSRARKGLVSKARKYGETTGTVGQSGNMESWRSMVAQALQMSGIGGGRSDENLWLKQIMTESSGNPNLVQSSSLRDINVIRGDPARGLVQVPGVTWADFGRGMGSFIPNVYNPLKNLIVGMRAANAQHKPDWRRVIGKGHGYEAGTKAAQSGWAIVGEKGPELVDFNGGESVYNNRETRRIIESGTRILSTPQAAQAAPAEVRVVVSSEEMRTAMNGMAVTLTVGEEQMSGYINSTVDRGMSDSMRRHRRDSSARR